MESHRSLSDVLGYVEAFRLVREAALYMIIASLLLGIGTIAVGVAFIFGM